MVDVSSLPFQNRTCSRSATQDLECGTNGPVHVDYPPCESQIESPENGNSECHDKCFEIQSICRQHITSCQIFYNQINKS